MGGSVQVLMESVQLLLALWPDNEGIINIPTPILGWSGADRMASSPGSAKPSPILKLQYLNLNSFLLESTSSAMSLYQINIIVPTTHYLPTPMHCS